MGSSRVLLTLVFGHLFHVKGAKCPGSVHIGGDKMAAIIPTGWNNDDGGAEVEVLNNRLVIPHMGGRAYFADTCTAGVYDHEQYAAYNLLGKTMRYTTDLSGAGCGCNAAFYLVSMRQNEKPSECSDYYCDANKVCGVPCAEIDIQEANQFSWHSTLHTATDSSGLGSGYGGGGPNWSGPRNWTSGDYAPGAKCIDTTAPFEVTVKFPVDDTGLLTAMEVKLSQDGRSCPLSLGVSNYKGMAELSAALNAGMTPVLSYWSSDDMLWMDGKGADEKGPCAKDDKSKCSDAVMFYGFSIEGKDIEYKPKNDPNSQPDKCSGEVVVRVPASKMPANFEEGMEVTIMSGNEEHTAEVVNVDWGNHAHHAHHAHTNSTTVTSPPHNPTKHSMSPSPPAAPTPAPASPASSNQPWIFVALILQSCLMCALCVYAYNLHSRNNSAGAPGAVNPDRSVNLTLVRKPLPDRSPTRNLLTGGWSPKEV